MHWAGLQEQICHGGTKPNNLNPIETGLELKRELIKNGIELFSFNMLSAQINPPSPGKEHDFLTVGAFCSLGRRVCNDSVVMTWENVESKLQQITKLEPY